MQLVELCLVRYAHEHSLVTTANCPIFLSPTKTRSERRSFHC